MRRKLVALGQNQRRSERQLIAVRHLIPGPRVAGVAPRQIPILLRVYQDVELFNQWYLSTAWVWLQPIKAHLTSQFNLMNSLVYLWGERFGNAERHS